VQVQVCRLNVRVGMLGAGLAGPRFLLKKSSAGAEGRGQSQPCRAWLVKVLAGAVAERRRW